MIKNEQYVPFFLLTLLVADFFVALALWSVSKRIDGPDASPNMESLGNKLANKNGRRK